MKIDLCVVSFNTKKMLERLVLGLSTEESLYRMLIWDNNSEDGTQEWLSTHMSEGHDPKLDWVKLSQKNEGYAAACNGLAAEGTNEIIGFLNADVWLTNQNLSEVSSFFLQNPNVDIMGPKQRDERGFITAAGIFGTNSAPKMRGWKIHDPEDKLYKDIVPAVTISGSAYFIRRSVFEALTNCPIYQGLEVVQNSEYKGAFLPTPHYY